MTEIGKKVEAKQWTVGRRGAESHITAGYAYTCELRATEVATVGAGRRKWKFRMESCGILRTPEKI